MHVGWKNVEKGRNPLPSNEPWIIIDVSERINAFPTKCPAKFQFTDQFSVRKPAVLALFSSGAALIFRCNIRFGDIITLQKLLQIAVIADQQNSTEFSCVDIFNPSYLLSGADARPDYRFQVFPVLGALFHFSSEHRYPLSEFDRLRCGSEGIESCGCILEVEYLRVTVVFVVHLPQTGIGIQHGLPGFHTVILHQLACDTHPCTMVESADFSLGI